MSGKHDENAPRHYYDACTLEQRMAYTEIINRKNPNFSVISHLSLGEAYGNEFAKGEVASRAFTNLIEKMRDYFHLAGNDGVDAILLKVKEYFPRLSITDAIHLSTAIKNQCLAFRTADLDLYGLDDKKVKKLASEFELPNFCISKMDNKSFKAKKGRY